MPRTGRRATGGLYCHVLNRGNAAVEVFRDAEDFAAFVELMSLAQQRVAMRVLGWCLMPDHFRLVLWPRADGDLAAWMQWLMTSHVRRHHARYGSRGHVWQGRFKSFPVQRRRLSARARSAGAIEAANPLWVLLRYVERVPLRAGVVRRAEDWRWSSLWHWARPGADRPLPIEPAGRPDDWLKLVHRPLTDAELAAVGHSLNRHAPLGHPAWATRVAAALGLEHTLRPLGRPRKDVEK